MKNYWFVRLGKANIYANECHKNGFIGVDFVGDIDLSNKLYDHWREFNHEMIPFWLNKNPGKSKIAAGLACGNLWVAIKGISIGDIVVSPMGNNKYAVGEIKGNYEFHKGEILPHRRAINWFFIFDKQKMSERLKYAAALTHMTVFNLTKYSEELENILNQTHTDDIDNETIDEIATFGLEKHLEEFLIENWQHTELSKKYEIYKDEEITGQQYPTDTGPIDILAISKDKRELLVIELKKGRASDIVIGQIQRYMGYVKNELAEENQTVKGLIISFEDDIRLQRALSVTSNIELMFYEIIFKLKKNKHG